MKLENVSGDARTQATANLPHSSRDVNQRIALVQHRKRILMSMHEPLLYVPLSDREQEPQEAKLLCFQYCNSVFLRYVPYSAPSEKLRRYDASHAVEGIVDNPVEHLNQEREALQYATVYMVAETRCVGCCNPPAEDASNFGCVGVLNRADLVEFAVAVGLEEAVGRLVRGVVEEAGAL